MPLGYAVLLAVVASAITYLFRNAEHAKLQAAKSALDKDAMLVYAKLVALRGRSEASVKSDIQVALDLLKKHLN